MAKKSRSEIEHEIKVPLYIPLQPKNEICRSSGFHAMPQFHIQLVNMTTNCLLSYLVSQEHWLHDYQYGESHQEHLHSVPSFQKKKLKLSIFFNWPYLQSSKFFLTSPKPLPQRCYTS